MFSIPGQLSLVSALVLVISGSAGAAPAEPWRQDVVLQEHLRIYDFPEELIQYHISPPVGTVQARHLKLQREGETEPLPYQLSDLEEKNGFLTRATLHFRSDLPAGGARRFRLVHDPAYTSHFEKRITVRKSENNTAEIVANRQRMRVPLGAIRYADGMPLSRVPAPLLAVARAGDGWIGKGSFEAPENLRVQSVRAEVVEDGPLFLRHRTTYELTGGRRYEVLLTLRHDESYITVDESLKGFAPEDAAWFRFSYGSGLDPDGRLVMSNGGYNRDPRGSFSGHYDRNLAAAGELPYELGLYTPNSLGVMRATAFWREAGEDALLFSLHRLPEWKTHTRHVWSAKGEPAHLHFYQKDGDKFLRTALLGESKHWALSVIPRSDLVVAPAFAGKDGPRWPVNRQMTGLEQIKSEDMGAGPEVRLWQKLTDFSLDHYKDIRLVWDEDINVKMQIAGQDPAETAPVTYEQWLGKYLGPFRLLVNVFWDYSGGLGGNHFGWVQEYSLPTYANSRANWTPEQRQHARALMVFLTYLQDQDSVMPHRSMMSGHPNFVGAMKQVYGIAAAAFPDHPEAKRWRDEYLRFWDEYLKVYVRPASPEVNALAGRWMENVTCYNFASMESANAAAHGLTQFDGTDIFAHPVAREWLNWNMQILVPFYEGKARIAPPQGAHARTFEVEPGGRWHNRILGVARRSAAKGSDVAKSLLWCLTESSVAGPEGVKPKLESSLFTDYGAILRYDFGGPNEAYLNIQQLFGRGYRWSADANGSLFYAAKSNRWSWNAMETSGDNFDLDRLPLFNQNGKSLGPSPITGILYDFGGAQYYRAEGVNPDYPARAVMMIRDDFIAVNDQVAPGKSGRFQWMNEQNGVLVEYFADTDFSRRVATSLDDTRFPFSKNWGRKAPRPGMKAEAFSVRFTGSLHPPETGVYRFKLNRGEGDKARLWLDDRLVIDGQSGATAEADLDTGRTYRLRVEYVHSGGEDASLGLRWQVPSGKEDWVWVGHFFAPLPLPEVYPVREGPGDQMHIVAPGRLSVTKRPFGAVVGDQEYVFHTATETNVQEENVAFQGAVGYARSGELALFQGSRVRYGDFTLERTGGDFGVSAQINAAGAVTGRFAGRQGGAVAVTPPAGFSLARAVVRVDGKTVDHRLENGAIHFDIAVSPADGCKAFSLEAL